MKIRILLIITLFFFLAHCMAQSITVAGTSWAAAIPTITEAGSNYTSSIVESGVAQSTLTVKVRNTPGLNHYTVNVKRTDSGNNWGTVGLQIWVKRTSTGTGGGNGSFILGGTTYLAITNTDSYFFDGSNDNGGTRSGITLQYQITGVSVIVPVATYSTTITYTLIDN